MLNTKKLLTKVLALCDGLVATKEFTSQQVSIAAGGTATVTIDCTKSGYAPIGLKHLQNNNGSTVIINGYWWNGDTLSVYNRNISSGAITNLKVVCTVTYVKTTVGGVIRQLLSRFNVISFGKGVAVC